MPPVDPRSDSDLLAALARGDAAAFDVLYARHRDFVYRVALRFCGNEADAADVSQEVFLDLVKRAGRVRLTSKLTTYLYPAIRNAAMARYRRDRPLSMDRSGRREQEAAISMPHAPPGHLRPLLDAVGALPAAQQEVLLMRIVDEMSVEEVATALGVPAGTVKSRLHAAIGNLRADGRCAQYFA